MVQAFVRMTCRWILETIMKLSDTEAINPCYALGIKIKEDLIIAVSKAVVDFDLREMQRRASTSSISEMCRARDVIRST